MGMVTVPNQLQKLHAGPGVLTKDTQHGTSDRTGILLLYAAHRHTQVRALTDDCHSDRLDLLEDRLRDLVGDPLLNLQPACEHIDQSRNLTQANNVVSWNVGHMAFPEKR